MLRLACVVAAFSVRALSEPIMVDPIASKQGDFKLMLFVPGGKVPPEDYLAFVTGAQEKSNLKLAVAIPRCHINLCDAIIELPGLLRDIVTATNKSQGGTLQRQNVFVTGHSLGGTGARHFYDIWPGSAGLALFGTQYNGDHEDYKGTLGYPVELKKFNGPLLALTGELDMVPISHTADLVSQWKAMGEPYDKMPIIILGMDHSQFCSPFNVSGDLQPEIPNWMALRRSTQVFAAWMDAVMTGGSDQDAVKLLKDYAAEAAPIAAPFIRASALDIEWCSTTQKLMMNSPANLKVAAEHRYASSLLEHCHPKQTLADGVVTATICDYRFYSYLNSTVPDLFPTYEGAQDISCKMSSEDKLAKELKLADVDMKSEEVMNRCKSLNQQAFEEAKKIINMTWSQAVKRFEEQGKKVTFLDDAQTIAGPQWVLSGLVFKESDTELQIQSQALISDTNSKIFPGSHYCKLLAPSKAVEFIMTTGLTKRLPVPAVQTESFNLVV